MHQYMRKSITTLVFVLASGVAGGVLAQAKPAAPNDTLWGISERYTDSPLRWPELWRINQDDIRNPHRIYPGNVIVLDRIRGTLSISGTQKLTPRVRPEPSELGAISAIPAAIIEPFLVRPLVVEADGLDRAPQIVAAEDRRVIIGAGNRAVVSGFGASREETWHIYRRGNALVDPDSKLTLGYEAAGRPQVISYLPRAPRTPVQGRVMSIYGGLGTISEGGPQSIITLNRGRADGLEVGHVLALHRIGENVVIAAATRDEPRRTIKLPDERYGLVFVFRTFERVSHARDQACLHTGCRQNPLRQYRGSGARTPRPSSRDDARPRARELAAADAHARNRRLQSS
jgi:hypothetical protein